MRALFAAALLCLAAMPAAGAELSGSAQAGGKPVPFAVVWLDAPAAPAFVQTKKVVLDQRNLDFNPRVLAVRVGTTVDFPNSDRVFHNVFSFRDGKKFDLGMYPVGTSRPIVFDTPGLSRVFCNIHPHMAAYVMAVDTPYFSVSDDGGAFTISGVPAGSYTYHAWRPGGQILSGSVTVDASHALEVRWP
jgi:plastocyanin